MHVMEKKIEGEYVQAKGDEMSTIDYSNKNNPKNRRTQHRILISTVICLGTMGIGFIRVIFGITLVHLSYLYEMDIQGASYVISFINAGIISGSLLCGILFDRYNALAQFSCGFLLIAVLISVTPWIPHVYFLYGAVVVVHLCYGYLFPALISYMISLWKGEGHEKPACQVVIAVFTAGAFIFPFTAMPFLVEIPNYTEGNNNKTYNFNGSTAFETNITSSNNYTETLRLNLTNRKYSNSVMVATDLDGIQDVRYMYLMLGLYLGFVGIIFILTTAMTKVPVFTEKAQKQNGCIKINACNYIQVAILVVTNIFIFFYFWYEYLLEVFLPTFAIKGIHITVKKAAMLSATYQGANFLGKVLSIFIAAYISPAKMITANTGFTLLGYITMLFVESQTALLWVSASCIGFFISSTYASVILWLGEYVEISGKVTSMFSINASFSCIIGSVLLGYLFEIYTHMCLVYLALSACVMSIVVFVVMNILGKIYKKSKFLKNDKDKENINISLFENKSQG